MFFSNNIRIDKNLAGLLLGAILSDTMNFKSPTTTSVDIEAAEKLVKISGVDPDELFKSIIEHADSLVGKRLIEIVYNDFKEFSIDGNRVGLSQAVCKSKDEYYKIRDDLQKYLDDACKSGGYDLMAIMLTLANGSGSYILSAGEKKRVVKDGFKRNEEGFVSGLVSRKKQLLPGVISSLGAK